MASIVFCLMCYGKGELPAGNTTCVYSDETTRSVVALVIFLVLTAAAFVGGWVLCANKENFQHV